MTTEWPASRNEGVPMGKANNIIGQSHNLLSILANNTDWESLDQIVMQSIISRPRWAGRHFTEFLRGGGKFPVSDPRIPIKQRGIFNPENIFGFGWNIIPEETDARSIALTEIDITKIKLVTMVQDESLPMNGEEHRELLKATSSIRLDADIFLTFLDDQDLIPESWKVGVNGRVPYIHFDGTVIRSFQNERCVPHVSWGGDRWVKGVAHLHQPWLKNYVSAVLDLAA